MLVQLLEKQVAKSIASRPCDGCTACCTVLGVEELAKPANVPCAHVEAARCGIYSTRPLSCQEFYCTWRMGLGTPEDRPDIRGIVFDEARKNVLEGKALVAREVWPGAFQEAEAFLTELASKDLLIVLVSPAGKPRRFIGPEEKILQVRPIIEEMIRQSRISTRGPLDA
jgi:Fe-S-cluster containining protein